MALKGTSVVYPVFPADKYACITLKPEAGTRTPFGGDPDRNVKEACFQFEWIAVDSRKKPLTLKIDGRESEVKFSKRTGMQYGGKRSSLTKIINAYFARPLTAVEFENFDLELMEGTVVTLLVSVEVEEGKEYNSIVGITVQKPLSLDLVSADPFDGEPA